MQFVVCRMARYFTAIFVLCGMVAGTFNHQEFESVLFKFIDQTNQISRLQHTRDNFRGRFTSLQFVANFFTRAQFFTPDAGVRANREFSELVDDIKQRHDELNQFLFHDNPNNTPLDSKKIIFMQKARLISQDLENLENLSAGILESITRLERMYSIRNSRPAPVGDID